jgi:hypothetical protein
MTGAIPSPRRPGRRAYLLIAAFALLLVLFPFLFWYGTWFGRRLTGPEIERYLHDSSRPRHEQHALVQIGERMAHGDPSVARWAPRIIELSRSPVLEVRQTTAWIMGQDHRILAFHAALLALVADPQPMVRRNAALSLAGFGDGAARPELLAMLRPFTQLSPVAGAVAYRLKPGEYVNPGTLVGRVGDQEVRALLPGEVRGLPVDRGGSIPAGAPLVEIGPDKDHTWEALRALYLVGIPEDLEDVARYARGVPGMPDKVREQAALTERAIRARAR